MIPFPDKKYKIIYADPPWSYEIFSSSIPCRTKENPYKGRFCQLESTIFYPKNWQLSAHCKQVDGGI